MNGLRQAITNGAAISRNDLSWASRASSDVSIQFTSARDPNGLSLVYMRGRKMRCESSSVVTSKECR